MSAAIVHLACGPVAQLLRDAPHALDWLSEQEHDRLARMATDRRRRQFLAARWQVRRLLADAFGGSARDWRLTADADAPPTVPGRGDLHLSISHSGAHAACAVGFEPLGLDLEAPTRERDIEGLAQLCCTPAEIALFRAAEDRAAMFHCLWTAKEAWLKRQREWIAPSRLQQIEVRPDAGRDVRTWSAPAWTLGLCAKGAVRWWTGEPAAAREWAVRDAQQPVSPRA